MAPFNYTVKMDYTYSTLPFILYSKITPFKKALLNTYAGGDQYKMMQQSWKRQKIWHMDTHLRVLSESYGKV